MPDESYTEFSRTAADSPGVAALVTGFYWPGEWPRKALHR